MTDQPAKARRILVVEDAPMIALDLQDMLEHLGCVVVGPTGNLAVAMRLASEEPIDAAVIDINIRGGKIFPVARMLMARGIPFLLASGYADRTLPPDLSDRPRLDKPYNAADLEHKLRALVDA